MEALSTTLGPRRSYGCTWAGHEKQDAPDEFKTTKPRNKKRATSGTEEGITSLGFFKMWARLQGLGSDWQMDGFCRWSLSLLDNPEHCGSSSKYISTCASAWWRRQCSTCLLPLLSLRTRNMLQQDTHICIAHCCVQDVYTELKTFDPSSTLTRFCLRKLIIA